MSESPNTERFSIHPNPHSSVEVHFSGRDHGGSVSVYDIHGSRVFGPVALQDGHSTFEIATLETGIYHVVLTTSVGMHHQQLVVLR
ncbi:MAG: T9SS type A sorting domain-containing protein [Ignavibacteria bacterium]|nr:T9SS type A sorting domain-containing protein [Ignavibacteria bacterium]